ncbi:ATP-dependent DNA helicase Q5 [Pseudolycoriella hygida]|uniref:DNA 3'-5' helicase n=1 Tax=Pseudolycoriella hygida TaxID=35572 RepID=A0A9Q0NG06_9DIPT|nr:ATP-dependent DNA helicase Q5 [Pseudolycoriella hygida]
MDDELRKQLSKKFGLNHFRSTTQKDAIKAILKNEQDVLVQMPSGSRKSLCFQLPGILQDKATIVISPRSSAIKDQIHYLKKYKIVAKSITSTTSDNEAEKIFNELMSEKPKTKFLFVTPDASSVQKLTDKLQSLCTNDKLAYLAVDEDFRKDYQEIGSLRKISSSIPWIVLTHNASMEVSNDIVEHLQLHKPVAEFRKSSFRKNLYYEVIFKNTLLDIFANLKQYVVNRLESAGEDDEKNNKKPSGIIFCKNRETVELVAKKLTEQGFSGAKAHHGGLTDRRKIQNDWISGLFPVIITTTSSGGGIDKSCVRFVVHWDVPCSISNYYKESGLAGQDGKLSYCRIYYCHEDMNSIDENLKEEIATSNKHNIAQALRNHADFLKMCDHCEMVSCRHKMFSDYFNDTTPNCKDQCDACKDRKESEIALSIFKQLTYTPARNTSSILDLELPDTNLPMTKEEPRNPQYDSHTNEHFDDFDDMSGIETDPFPLRRNGYISPARLIAEDNCDYSQVPRCVSPAETVIDVKTNLNDNVNAIFLNSAPSTSQFSQTIVVKTEPTEMTRDVEETTQTSYSTEFTGLTTSTTQENQLHQDLPDTATASETGRTQPATVVTSETCRIQPRDQLSGTTTPIKQERTVEHPPATDETSKTCRIQPRDKLSGTTTPIKQERTVEHPPATDATSETYRIQPRDQLSGIETPIKQERTVEHPPAPVATLETYRIQRKDQLSGIATPIKQERTVEHLPPPVATLETYRIQRKDQLSGIATPIKQERTVEHLPPPVATLETYRIQRRDQLSGTATPIKQERTVEHLPPPVATLETYRIQRRDQLSGTATPIKQERTVEHLPPPVATLETYRIQRRDQLSGTATPIKQERTVEHLPPPVATLETYRIQRRDQLLGTATPIKQERTVELQPATLATVEIRRTQLRDQSPGIATPIKHDRASTMSRESVISLSPTRAIINDDSDVDMGCVDAQHSQTQRVTNRERITQQKPAKIELSKILCKDSHLLRETNKNKKRENYGDVDLDIEIISDDSFTGNTPSPEYRTASPTKFSRSHEPYKSSKTNATNSRARYQNSSPIRSRSGSSERFKRSKMRRHSRSRSIEIFERDRSRSSEGYDRGAKHHRKSESTRRTKRRHPSSESEFSDSSHRRREKESGQRHHGEGHRHRKRKRKHKKSSRRDHKNDHRREDRNEWHSSERSCSPQPGTSKNLRRNPAYDFAKMRFSLSPEAKDEKESVDYGWEDSPPPKPEAKPEADPKYLGEDFNEKIKILQDRVQNEYDLEKIEEASKDLFRAVEEKIAIEANRKLKELDSRIQKRKDDYALKLFGTTNFDSWDDDPALSNVAAASKLKKFKPLVPDDIPLLEKMSMKYNRQMPPHLLDSIKKEKTTIAEIVKQYLKPYYNLGRFEPKDKNFFGVVARKICHVFYDRQSDENTIKKFIDSIFMRENKITRSTNLDFSI